MGARVATTFLVASLTTAAVCQVQVWGDDFDSYTDGTELYHIGGWTGWDDVQTWAGIVSNTFSRSAPNSFHIEPPDTDAVQPIFAVDCGQWVLTAWWYIPTGGLAGGDAWFIIQNEYAHGGPYQWALQTRADVATSMIIDDFRPSNAVPVVFDQWIEFVIDIDLDANTCTQTYNGMVVSTGIWNILGGQIELANLDLFSTGGDSYYDDITLVATGNQDGEVLPQSIGLSLPNPQPGDMVDIDVVVENDSMSALTNVRVDLFIDPTSLPGGDAFAAMDMSMLFDDTLSIMPGPGTTAMALFAGQTSMVDDIWRIYATVNSDENVCGDGWQNNLLGPVLLGFASPGVAGGLCGDCNRDGTVTILDALRGSQLGAAILMATPADYPVCDVDDSASITVLDALRIAQESAGLMPPLMCPPGGSAHLVEIASPLAATAFGAGDVSVRIDLWDPVGAGIDNVAVEFSVNGGVTFNPCTDAGGTLTGGAPASSGADQEFLWDASTDIPVRPTMAVELRVTATINTIDKIATVGGLDFN